MCELHPGPGGRGGPGRAASVRLTMTDLRTTSLFDRHTAAGASFGPFAGWQMPLHYGSPRSEHMAVRTGAGVFDVSHMGQIEITGSDARDFLAHALTNAIDAIGHGQGQYTLMLDDDGGVIDDLIVYAGPDRYLLVVNAANVEACDQQLRALAEGDVQVVNRSDQLAMIALQGPDAKRILAGHVADPATLELAYFAVTEDDVAGAPSLVARTGYTGEAGVEVICRTHDAPAVWDAFVADGAVPAGLVARDTLRTEACYPLYGQELGRDRTPIPAGLRWAMDLDGGRFVGYARCQAEVDEGPRERLVAFVLDEPGIPRPGLRVHNEAGEEIGTVTSGTLSPVLEKGIGLAYVRPDCAAVDTPLVVDIRGKLKRGHVAARPLVDTSATKG